MIQDKIKPMVGAGLALIAITANADAPRDFCERAINAASQRYVEQLNAYKAHRFGAPTMAEQYAIAIKAWSDTSRHGVKSDAPAPVYPTAPVMLIPKECADQYVAVEPKE